MKRRLLWTVPVVWQSVAKPSCVGAETNIFEIEKCPNGHYCENGSTCQVHPEKENVYYCDCTSSSKVVAGLRCEFEATTFCDDNNERNYQISSLSSRSTSSSFCTNNAACIDISTSSAGYPSKECLCPLDYEGDHCEFKIGTMPRDLPYIRKQKKHSSVAPSQKLPLRIEIDNNIRAAEALAIASFRKGSLRKAL